MRGINPAFLALFVSCLASLVAADAKANETSPLQAVYKQVKQYTHYDAVLKCIIQTKDATGIQWTRNGKEVKGGSRHTIVKSANITSRSTSLKIKSLEAADYGEYVCHATISGKNYSESIKLVERKKDSVVRPVEKVVKQNLNSSASLKCLMPKHSTSINWLKNGAPVKTGDRHEIIRSSTDKFRATTLNIKSIEQADYGSYECSANVSGKIISAVIKLSDKKGPPPVEASHAEVKEALGSNVILRCDLSKNPSSVTWSKNGTKLKSDEHRTVVKYTNKQNKITATTLNFKKLVADDFGTYECESIVSGKKYSASVKLVEKK